MATDNKNNLNHLLLIVVLIAFCLSNRASNTQTITQWEYLDYNENRDYTIARYINFANVIAGFNENDIILCSQSKDVDKSNIIELITNKGNEKKVLYSKSDKYFEEFWNSVSHPSPNVIVVVGDSTYSYMADNKKVVVHNNLILISRDSGNSWERIIKDSNQHLVHISMYDSLHGAIISNFKNNIANPMELPQQDSLWVTNDCWRTIKKVALPNVSAYHKKVFRISKDKFALLTWNAETGQSYMNLSNDGGESWERSANIGNDIFPNRAFFTDNYAYAIGSRKLAYSVYFPVLFRSPDGGYSWEEITNIFDSDYYTNIQFTGLYFYDDMNGIIVTKGLNKNGPILRTNDGGETWIREFPPYIPDFNIERYRLEEVYYPNADFAIATFVYNALIKCETKQSLPIPKFQPLPNGYILKDEEQTLSWHSVNGAENYQVKIAKVHYLEGTSDSSRFANPLIDTVLTGTSLTLIGDFTEGLIYFSWIRALGNNINSNWSIRNYLFVVAGEDYNYIYPPKVQYPANGLFDAPTELTVQWSKVTRAEYYEMKVSIDIPNNIWDYFFDLKDTKLTLEGLDPNRAYIIDLRSHKGDNKSQWSTSFFMTGAVTSVEDNELDINNSLSFFPNPTLDKSTIIINAEEASPAEVIIYNVLGVEVRRFEYILDIGENYIPINMTNLISGFYFVKVRTDDKVLGGKIIKN